MMMRLLIVLLIALFVATAVHAGEPSGYTRYLIPVASIDAPGAHGSRWRTELTAHNSRDHELEVRGLFCPPTTGLLFCGDESIPPHVSETLHPRPSFDGREGAFIYVPDDPHAPGPFVATLRVRDLSKNAESFGTEIPIVKLADFAQFIVITDVPTDPRFRATLRIYNANETPREVVMRVYTLTGTTPLVERSVSLTGILPIVFDPFPSHPGSTQIDPLTGIARAEDGRVRIEIEDPIRHIVSPPPAPIWALVSITNNETQQVTTIRPHP